MSRLIAEDLDRHEAERLPCPRVIVRALDERVTYFGGMVEELPPLDIPQEREPMHFGATFKAEAPKRETRAQRGAGVVLAILIGLALFAALAHGLGVL
jgi:hypothetical protein